MNSNKSSESKSKNIALSIIIMISAVAIAVAGGLFLLKSPVFSSDPDYYKEAGMIFNPAEYMANCVAPTYEDFMLEYETYGDTGIRFYGQIKEIEEQLLGQSTKFILKVPKFDEKTARVSEAEQYIICSTELDFDDYSIYTGDNIFIYGDFIKMDSKSKFPHLEVRAMELDTDE